MKVDANGRPVSEGTFGLYGGGYAAQIVRTFINPVEDDERTQEVLNEGGYIIKTADDGEFICESGQFTMDDQPDKVIAQDGQEVKEGDEIETLDGQEGTVMSVWPTSKLSGGMFCCSLVEKIGDAPDGHYGVVIGGVGKVLRTAAGIDWKALGLKVGDRIEFQSDKGDEGCRGTIETFNEANRGRPMVVFSHPDDKPPTAWNRAVPYHCNKAIYRVISREGEETKMSDEKKKKQQPALKLEVKYEGAQISVPPGMPTKRIIEELTRKLAQEETEVAIMELVDGFPLDAAHAFVKALEMKYGWVNSLPTPGFFGPTPPTMVGVQTDPDGGTVQIPWGRLGIPNLNGYLETGIQFKDNRPVFCIGGKVKQKDKGTVSEIAQMARDYLKANSLYRGKAISVKFPDDNKKFSPLDNQPRFMRVADVRPEELIFPDDTQSLIQVNLWTLIENLPAVRAAKIPVKRGILVHGKFGVGKTLLATVTGQKAVKQGVTFIDLVDSRQLPQAVQFARTLGGPVCIFAEDIDRTDENGSRTDAFNEILNTVDGLMSKNDEVVIVMTTNHIERISQAMLRPGRLDAVIEIPPPDEKAVQRLVRLYARHMLHPDADIREIGKLLQGEIPASVREVVERAKLSAITRGDVHHISPEDLRVAAIGMRSHLDLLKDKPKDDRSELEKLGQAVGHEIAVALVAAYNGACREGINERDEDVEELIGRVTRRKVA